MAAVPRWISLSLWVLGMIWTLAYPLGVARYRGVALRLPRRRDVVVETLLALALLVPIIALMMVGFSAMTYFFGEAVMPPGPVYPLGESLSESEWKLLLILAVFVAPICEEVFFRGLLYNVLRMRMHPAVAASIQGAVFGLMHRFEIGHTVIIAIVAVCLAAVYEWRKTLLTPIVLHALVNIVGMTAMTAELNATAAAPVLGVAVDAHQGGCLVTSVAADSAAAEAGLRVGDVLTAVNGRPVANLRGLRLVLRAKRVGDEVPVDFIRDGKTYRVDALLRARPK
jgi:membrane protease YdiL (CAAX protease family)